MAIHHGIVQHLFGGTNCCTRPGQPFLLVRVFPASYRSGLCCILLLFSSFSRGILYQGFENLVSRISRLSALKPLAISVTWGAGGSTKDRSLELASIIQNTDVNTILHLTCTNMQMGLIDQVLKVYKLFWNVLLLLILSLVFA